MMKSPKITTLNGTTLIRGHHYNRETNSAQKLLDWTVNDRWRLLNYVVTVLVLLLHCQCHYKAPSCNLVLSIQPSDANTQLHLNTSWTKAQISLWWSIKISQYHMSYGSYVNPSKHSSCPSIQHIPTFSYTFCDRCITSELEGTASFLQKVSSPEFKYINSQILNIQ